MEYALRMTLVSDALSLQFRLPPSGMALPTARSSVVIAGGTPVVDALVLSSVWAVHVLRMLCLVGGWLEGRGVGVRILTAGQGCNVHASLAMCHEKVQARLHELVSPYVMAHDSLSHDYAAVCRHHRTPCVIAQRWRGHVSPLLHSWPLTAHVPPPCLASVSTWSASRTV